MLRTCYFSEKLTYKKFKTLYCGLLFFYVEIINQLKTIKKLCVFEKRSRITVKRFLLKKFENCMLNYIYR